MKAYVQRCQAGRGAALQQELLQRVLVEPLQHARWLNTLARLEYVGVRKMLKARRSESLDFEGLQHILEEAVHSVRLKKFARAACPDPRAVATFSAEHTLAGGAGENYFQAVDAAAQGQTVDAETCYRLTSTVIEVRAKVFYPLYQSLASALGVRVALASIISDEEGHLEQMAEALPERMPQWQPALEQVLEVEEQEFCRFMGAALQELNALRQS